MQNKSLMLERRSREGIVESKCKASKWICRHWQGNDEKQDPDS